MDVGHRRTVLARLCAALGFLCGLLGFLAAMTGHNWKMGAYGWFTGGVLVALLGIVSLLDGMFAFQKNRKA